MAGFFSKIYTSYRQNDLPEFIKELGTLGVKSKIEIMKNSYSIGYNQETVIQDFSEEMEEYEFLNLINTQSNKYLPFFDSQYKERRPYLREISKEGKIEGILTILTDEAIVYDDSNYFCKVEDLKVEFKNRDEIQKSLERNFKKIYNLFGFNDVTTVWWLFYKFLVDGFLAFEIVYDKDGKTVIGFKEIDPVELKLNVDQDGNQVWVQFEGDATKQSVLYDSQIIYISYASALIDSRVSYTERLIKPFNLLQMMEQTRSTWAVANASMRMKFVIPVGGKSKNMAKQTLRKLMNRYNEEISFDSSSGQYHINGKPYIPGVKQIWLPEKDGETPTIETVGIDAPEMNDVDILLYYRKELETLSKIPSTRFEKAGSDTFDNTASQITQEELRFNRFIIRLRSIFKELIVKPLYLQMCIEYPNLKNDPNFKNAVNIEYIQYNLFEKFKKFEVENKVIEHIQNIMNLTDKEGNPIAPLEFWMKKYELLTEEELREIEELKKKADKEAEKETDLGADTDTTDTTTDSEEDTTDTDDTDNSTDTTDDEESQKDEFEL